MTNLFDRETSLSRIKNYLELKGKNDSHALFIFNITNFRYLSNIIGGYRGDELMDKIADTIHKLFRITDIIGRYDNERFIVLMKHVSKMEVIRKKSSELVDALQFVCTTDGISIQLSVNVGACFCRPDKKDVYQLYEKAESALEQAILAGKNQYALYNGESTYLIQGSVLGEARASTVQLSTLLENMNGGVMIAEIGKKIDITYISPSFFKTMNCSIEQVGGHGEKFFDIIESDDREKFEDALFETAMNGNQLDIVCRVNAMGGYEWWHMRAVRLSEIIMDGDIQTVIIVITDVSELKDSTTHLEAIVDNSPVGIGIFEIVKRKTSPQYFNKALLDMIGCSPEEMAEITYNDALVIVHPDEVTEIRSGIISAVEKKLTYEFTCRTVDDLIPITAKYLNVRCVQIDEHNGNPVLLAIFSDITRERELEDKLRMAEETYRIAVEQTGILIWRVDIPARTLYQSAEVSQAVGHSGTVYQDAPESIIKTGFIHPDSEDEYRRMFNDLYLHNENESYYIQTKDDKGGFVWGKARFSLLRYDDGIPYYAIGIIDYRQNVEAEMKRFEQEMRFAKRAETILLGLVIFNISKNKVDYINIPGDARYEKGNLLTYNELQERYVETINNREDKYKVSHNTQKEALIDLYRRGQNLIYTEYRRQDQNGNIRWTMNSINIIRHPVSGDLYGTAFINDIDLRRRLELSLPARVERDPLTMLYTKETANLLAANLIDSYTDIDNSSVLMCVYEFSSYYNINDDVNNAQMNNVKLNIGRLIRIYTDSSAIAGSADENHITIFKCGITDEAAERAHAEGMLSNINEMLAINFSGETYHVYMGFAVVKASEAQIDLLFEKAMADCKKNDLSDNTEKEKQVKSKIGKLKIPEKIKNIDPQTGLLTRQDYYNTLKRLSPDSITTLGAMFIDINGLGELNHRYGMNHGDGIICFISETLSEIFAYYDVYRMSGDEFLVLSQNIAEKNFIGLCEQAENRFNETYPSLISVGYTWDDYVKNIQTIVDHAEELMQDSKMRYYQGSAVRSEGSLHMKSQLWLIEGMENKYFKIYLQPKAETETKTVTACEALVRYQGTDNIILAPGRFIPSLERENLLRYLDIYMLGEAVDILWNWKCAGHKLLPISVNFSRKTLLDSESFESVKKMIEGKEELIKYLAIEVTESLGFIERSTAARACELYRNAGFQLSLDDFGSEYSSLYIISALRFDEIKIDKSVIDDIVTNELSRITVEYSKRICDMTGAYLIAEGVETEEQLKTLSSLGCHMIQGYLINKPLPAAEFTEKYIV